jgi:hypothetical protein
LRTFNKLNFDLYYLPAGWAAAWSPGEIKAAAVGAAPILGVSAKVGGVVTFSVNTLVDGSANPASRFCTRLQAGRSTEVAAP